MFFDSVEKVLAKLEQQPGWEKFRQHRQLLTCWESSVNKNVACHTRLLYVNRQILWVATSSAARAQELSFQRYSLLKKLNKQLPFILKDIRFSSSQWHQTTDFKQNDSVALFSISKRHKIKANSLSPTLNPKRREKYASATDAKAAAQRWLEKIEKNSSSFLSCPNCESPTPSGEIERWNSCYHCVAQKWSKEYLT